jgi:hypothetical protein
LCERRAADSERCGTKPKRERFWNKFHDDFI